MEPLDYLRSIAQRWRIVLVVPVLLVLVAWVTTPSASDAALSTTATAPTATASLLPDTEGGPSMAVMQLLARGKAVSTMVAETLGDDVETVEKFSRSVKIVSDDETGILRITAEADDPTRAVAVAGAYADSLIRYLAEREETRRTTEIDSLEKQYAAATQRAAEAARVAVERPGDLLAQLDKASTAAALLPLYDQIIAVGSQPPATGSLEIIERPVLDAPEQEPATVTASGISSRRLLMAGVAGLGLGGMLALALARFDTRPRTRVEMETAYNLSVLAEVPPTPGRRRHAMGLEVLEKPEGAVADGYRTLRSALMLLEPTAVTGPGSGPPTSAALTKNPGLRQVILVTSAREGEGKTTTVTNLAAALAEIGKQVLVIDCDLRNPQCHRFLDVPSGTGITDLVGTGLEHLARQTKVPGVRLVQAGTGDAGRALLAVQLPDSIDEARSLADVVIVDAPPVLAGNEALDVMAAADAVLIVARAGRATADEVGRTREMVRRMQVPVYGVALVGSSGGGLPAVPLGWARRPSSRSNGSRSTGRSNGSRSVGRSNGNGDGNRGNGSHRARSRAATGPRTPLT